MSLDEMPKENFLYSLWSSYPSLKHRLWSRLKASQTLSKQKNLMAICHMAIKSSMSFSLSLPNRSISYLGWKEIQKRNPEGSPNIIFKLLKSQKFSVSELEGAPPKRIGLFNEACSFHYIVADQWRPIKEITNQWLVIRLIIPTL